MTSAEDRFAECLLAHFDAHRRDLPWRAPGIDSRRDPYAVLVSEAMLQQTRVRTVERYFPAWLERFPDVRALARAERDDVLRAWEGMGYYRRAHALHRAAMDLVERFDGKVPSDPDELRTLAGIGPYTAAAIAAFAYDEPVVAVDANVRRLACRLLGHRDAPSDAVLSEALLARAPTDRHGDYAEALVELGATVCTASSPDCRSCPLQRWCLASRAGPEGFPKPRRKRRPPTRERFAWIVRRDDAVLLERSHDGMLAGMWGFPQRERPIGATGAHVVRRGRTTGQDVVEPGPSDRASEATTGCCALLPPIHHSYTHFRLVLTPCLADADEAARVAHPNDETANAESGPPDDATKARPPRERRFAPWHSVPDLAMSVVDRKVVAALVRHGHAPAEAIAGGADPPPARRTVTVRTERGPA